MFKKLLEKNRSLFLLSLFEKGILTVEAKNNGYAVMYTITPRFGKPQNFFNEHEYIARKFLETNGGSLTITLAHNGYLKKYDIDIKEMK